MSDPTAAGSGSLDSWLKGKEPRPEVVFFRDSQPNKNQVWQLSLSLFLSRSLALSEWREWHLLFGRSLILRFVYFQNGHCYGFFFFQFRYSAICLTQFSDLFQGQSQSERSQVWQSEWQSLTLLLFSSKKFVKFISKVDIVVICF